MADRALTRRDTLQAALAASLGLALAPDRIWATVAATATHPGDPMLDRVCDLVIPATGTAGALGVRVPDFIRLALAHADGETMHGTEWETVSKALAARGFGAGPDDAKILAAFDAEAYRGAPQGIGATWRQIKSLIITGYYTSEIGGAHELRYDLSPGHFDADVTLAAATPALSNDWIAVNFR